MIAGIFYIMTLEMVSNEFPVYDAARSRFDFAFAFASGKNSAGYLTTRVDNLDGLWLRYSHRRNAIASNGEWRESFPVFISK